MIPKVLLVEDNPDDRFFVRRVFDKIGFEAKLLEAGDGEEAVRLMDTALKPRLELVLLDIKMPRKDGFEVLRWIRNNPTTQRIPVVMLTSSEEPSDLKRAYDLGANSYLIKPVGYNALLDMLKTLGLYWLIYNRSFLG